MKKYLLFIVFLWAILSCHAQVPNFSSQNYAGWDYNNPAIYLNEDNILANRIVLYKASTGYDLTLTSPEFTCSSGHSINMHMTWVTTQWMDEGFDMSKVSITAALLNHDGFAVDSVTYDFTSINKTNHVYFSIDVPKGLTRARLRFASWKADVNSNGAVRQIEMTTTLYGDVNNDGEITLADVNAVISVILGVITDPEIVARADVDHDGEVGVGDINRVLDFILF